MTAPIKAAATPARLPFVDNLRSMTIMLVVTMHAAVTYSNFGSWYFMEPAPKDKPTLLVFGMYQSFLQAWFMGFLFFLAGYFASASFDRKGPRRFIADRAYRLGIPSLIYVFAIQPFIVWFMLPMFYRGHSNLGEGYVRYITKFSFLSGTGPMWFAVALLIFCLAYAAARMISPSRPRVSIQPVPGNRQVIMLVLAIAVSTFLVRTVQPVGSSIFNMQLCYFSQYVILFTMGTLAWRGDWVQRIPYSFGIRWLAVSSVGGVALWFAVFVGGGVLSGASMSVFNGGWHWQSAGVAFWESFYCVGTCLGLIVLFRDKVNSQSRSARFLSDNSFAVYVFHPPILIAITFALHNFTAPALIRFVVASALAIAASYLASHFVFRRIPLLKEVL
jgi:glucans biosynthesis protein C